MLWPYRDLKGLAVDPPMTFQLAPAHPAKQEGHATDHRDPGRERYHQCSARETKVLIRQMSAKGQLCFKINRYST